MPINPDRETQWRTAIRLSITEIDNDVLDFITSELVWSGFTPLEADDLAPDIMEQEETTLHSHIGDHLVTLLDVPDSDTVFIVRDIYDNYRFPPTSHAQESSTNPSDRPKECELCDRPMFLTIHHLFPRSEHDYFLRHPPADLPLTKQDLLVNYRAWLCRPCHSAVHRIATNRELGTLYWSLELLMGNEELRRWVGYVSKQRASTKNHGRYGLRYKR